MDILFLASQATGWSAGRLAKRFGVSRRRIFDDVQQLARAGYRIFHDGQGYRLPNVALSLPVTLRTGEILALLRPGVSRGDRDLAQLKLANALPSPLKEVFRSKVRAAIQMTPIIARIWDALDLGLGERKVLQLSYGGLAGPSGERSVEPQALFMKGTGWYLAAWCRRARGWRLFRLDRIVEAAPTPESFVPRPGFDVEAYIGSDVGVWVGKALDAEVEVLSSHVEAVRSEALAKGLRFRRSARGALLEIPRGHVDEAAWWLASFGEGVRVIRPPELRDRLAAIGRRIVELNGG